MPTDQPTAETRGQLADRAALRDLTARYWTAFQAGNDAMCAYLEPQVRYLQQLVQP